MLPKAISDALPTAVPPGAASGPKPRTAAFLPLCGLAALFGGCGALPRYAASSSRAEPPDSLTTRCKREAEEAAQASSVDALPPDPSAKNALGAFVGNSIGRAVVLRRSYGKCMEESGYVRLR